MTSNTPEEIAISVAAQILREREKLFTWARPSRR
jgi:xanthine/CO dehydrogenase XdhC/CoxF family maturation factor